MVGTSEEEVRAMIAITWAAMVAIAAMAAMVAMVAMAAMVGNGHTGPRAYMAATALEWWSQCVMVLQEVHNMYPCILCTVYYALHTMHCILSTAYYPLHTIHCILCTAYYAGMLLPRGK